MAIAAPRHSHNTDNRTWDDRDERPQRTPIYRVVARWCGGVALFAFAVYLTVICMDVSAIGSSWSVPYAINGFIRTLISMVGAVWLSEIMTRMVFRDELARRADRIRKERENESAELRAEVAELASLLQGVLAVAGGGPPQAQGRVWMGSHLREVNDDTEPLPKTALGLDADVISLGHKISAKIAANGASSGPGSTG